MQFGGRGFKEIDFVDRQAPIRTFVPIPADRVFKAWRRMPIEPERLDFRLPIGTGRNGDPLHLL